MFFLEPFKGKNSLPPPLWLMRQAGRYLPEYRKLRASASSFLDFVFTPELAAEATLQPLKRFNLDAAIVFSDILVIPYALGQKVEFLESEGPVLAPLDFQKPLGGLTREKAEDQLNPVLMTISKVRKSLPISKTLIGFAGGPWTVAAYMLEGKTSRDFLGAKSFAMAQPEKFKELLDLVTETTISYLKAQIGAGANVLQLFESWAGVVPASHYKEWIEIPTARIVREVKKSFPEIPFLAFPKGLGALIPSYVSETGVDGLSLDSSYPLNKARELSCVIQGNLDPVALLAGGNPLKEGVQEICRSLKGKPFIFNLGHGVLKETSVANIAELIELVRNFEF